MMMLEKKLISYSDMEEPIDSQQPKKKKKKNFFSRFIDNVLEVFSAIGDLFG